MKFINGLIIILLVIIRPISVFAEKVLTPLEIQSMQTREYSQGIDIVFPSVVSVFQDLGYMVKSADKSSGFINAESPAITKTAFLGGRDVYQTAATGFIERIGKITRVRLSFVVTKNIYLGLGDQKRQDTPIVDAPVYSNAFEKIENAIFVRSQQ